MRSLILSSFVLFGFGFAFGQSAPPKLGIVNGMATYLPKPVYPKVPLDACARGKVSVKVLINENGRVRRAESVSGSPFLRRSAVDAAKRARFRLIGSPPVKRSGILVYNFPSSKGCGNVASEPLTPDTTASNYFRCFRKNNTIFQPSNIVL